MSDYTPDTEGVLEAWVWQRYEEGYHGPCPNDPAEFYRWLAEHDAEVQAPQTAVIEAVRNALDLFEGAEFDILNGRPYLDAEEEKSSAIRRIRTAITITTPVSETRKEQI